MSAIASTDVTYSALSRRKVNGSPSRYVNLVTVAFGDSALTYPSGGVALLKASMGLPNVIETLKILDSNASGYIFKWDKANNKLRIYQAPAQTHTHNLLLKNAAVADGASARVNAGANLLGANTGSDLTVTGGGANGGVVSTTLAAAADAELVATAIAAQTLILEVSGY